jgi:hypothetical protein
MPTWGADETTQLAFSASNIANSVALELAARLANLGYLLYWHQIDAVQVDAPGGDLWYPEYSTRQATYLADPTYAASVASAKGLLTIRSDISAIPRFVTRHTLDGTVAGQDEVPVPCVSLLVGPMRAGENRELGTHAKWRARHIQLIVLARDAAEQQRLEERFAVWFDRDTLFEVANHDDGTGAAVGDVRTCRPSVIRATVPDDAEAVTYQVIVNALLEYQA